MNNVSTVICRLSTTGARLYGRQINLLSSSSTYVKFERPFPAPQALHQSSPAHAAHYTVPTVRQPCRSCPILPRPLVSNHLEHLARAAFSTSVIKPRSQSPKPSVPKHSKPNTVSSKAQAKNHRYARAVALGSSSVGEAQTSSTVLKEFSQAKISEILGPTISKEDGNKLFRDLQKQRITGTLDYGVSGPALNDHLIANALAWLRTNYPLDEDAAIIRRIEDEDRKASEELIARAERIGLYKPQQSAARDGIYGKSVLEDVRKHNENEFEKQKKEQKVKDQAEEIRNAADDSALIQSPQGRAVLARRSETAEWLKRYKERAQLSKDKEPPKMSILRRLLPSGLFGLCIIGLCILFAQNYVPPPREARIWPDTPPAAATVLALISMNIAVTMMWKTPPLWRFLNKYFIMVPGWPRPASLLGNIFSHQKVAHLIGNMIGLWFVGTQLHDDTGRGLFLAIFFSCGILASYFSLSSFVLRNNLIVSSLGSSGAITGLIATMCSLHSGESFTLSLLPPDKSPHLSANAILITLVTYEVFATALGWQLVDHWAHLGGYLAGIAIGQILKYRKQQRKETEIRRPKKYEPN